jgi:hypothetical protein
VPQNRSRHTWSREGTLGTDFLDACNLYYIMGYDIIDLANQLPLNVMVHKSLTMECETRPSQMTLDLYLTEISFLSV